MGLRAGREHVLALEEHRNEDRVVGRVRVAEVRVVVEEGVALGEVGVELRHRLGEELRADHVHRQPLGGCQELVVGR